MRNKRGRPPNTVNKADHLQIRVDSAEKQAFTDAAALVGQSVSVWVRDQLRRVARQQLEEAGQPVAFLQQRAQVV
jgi:uncharacterized protein (DUF1778 family)